MTSFVQRLAEARAEIARCEVDPLHEKVKSLMRNRESIGTAPLLELLDMRKTSSNARCVAKTMRTLGYVPITSRRFLPGGHAATVTRGWTRPVRHQGKPARFEGDRIRARHLYSKAAAEEGDVS